ncbi:hypothetical protein C8Q78DRAFT_99062 [Trametes maxima]|nr:hypothetical protein C8Q78DRAFT_99062 [Trametes maxima]
MLHIPSISPTDLRDRRAAVTMSSWPLLLLWSSIAALARVISGQSKIRARCTQQNHRSSTPREDVIRIDIISLYSIEARQHTTCGTYVGR